MNFSMGKIRAKNRPYRFLLLGLASTVALAACGSSSSSSASATSSANSASQTNGPASGTPYVIHAVLSETGVASELGTPEAQTLKALAAYENTQGGINGHPVQFDIQDNQSTPSLAVSLSTSLLAHHVNVLLDGSYGATDIPVDGLAGSNGPFISDLAPTVRPKAGSMVFRTGTPMQEDFQVILNYLKAKGLTRIAAITSTDSDGTLGWTDLQSTLAQPQYSSFKVTAHQVFDPTAVSVATQLSVLKVSNPQAILVWTVGSPFGTVLQGLSSLGMGNIPIFTSNGNADYGLLGHLSSVVPKSLYFIGEELYMPPSEIKNAAVRAQVQAFDTVIQAAGGKPEAGYGLAWSAGSLVIGAIKKLGIQATAPQILQYMQSLNNSAGIYGLLNFSKDNHDGISTQFMHIFHFTGTSFQPVSHGGGAPLTSASSPS
ncbi:MAG: hypothetical protein EPN30_03380 [Actinomycetota bacterium]|nr:MAG: hypothetical protein EPN30_03380 [Actinomycetota bacterium]